MSGKLLRLYKDGKSRHIFFFNVSRMLGIFSENFKEIREF